jgi:hypothetical protein
MKNEKVRLPLVTAMTRVVGRYRRKLRRTGYATQRHKDITRSNAGGAYSRGVSNAAHNGNISLLDIKKLCSNTTRTISYVRHGTNVARAMGRRECSERWVSRFRERSNPPTTFMLRIARWQPRLCQLRNALRRHHESRSWMSAVWGKRNGRCGQCSAQRRNKS